MNHKRPLVSVILPVRNREAWVGRTIESVLAQSYQEIELIAVDDGSTDNTSEILRSYRSRISLLTQPGMGVYAARNRALQAAKGALVAFIDSDDAWLPHKLSLQVPLFAKQAEVAVVYGDAKHISADEAVEAHPFPGRTGATCFSTTSPARGRIAGHLVWGNCVPTITVVARREALVGAGGFSTSHQLSADYLLWFRVGMRSEFDYVEDIVAHYTVHKKGISSNLTRALTARIELFMSELESPASNTEKDLVKKTLGTLGVSLFLSLTRARAPRTDDRWKLAVQTMKMGGSAHMFRSIASLPLRRAQARSRSITNSLPGGVRAS